MMAPFPPRASLQQCVALASRSPVCVVIRALVCALLPWLIIQAVPLLCSLPVEGTPCPPKATSCSQILVAGFAVGTLHAMEVLRWVLRVTSDLWGLTNPVWSGHCEVLRWVLRETSEPSLTQYGVDTVISLYRRINWGVREKSKVRYRQLANIWAGGRGSSGQPLLGPPYRLTYCLLRGRHVPQGLPRGECLCEPEAAGGHEGHRSHGQAELWAHKS